MDDGDEVSQDSSRNNELTSKLSKRIRGRSDGKHGSLPIPSETVKKRRNKSTRDTSDCTPKTPSKSNATGKDKAKSAKLQHQAKAAKRKGTEKLAQSPSKHELGDHEDPESPLAGQVGKATDVNSDGENDGSETELLATPSSYKSRKRKESPSPEQNLNPYEHYFWKNRPGKLNTSNNTLSSLSLLSHEEYYNEIDTYEDPHETCFSLLHSLHSRSFAQWRFELSESYNVCLYGYGSKRKLVKAFAQYLCSDVSNNPPNILMVNGYDQTLTARQLFNTLSTLVFKRFLDDIAPQLGNQPRDMLATLLDHLHTHPPDTPHKVLINSLDAPSLRRPPIPVLLAQLAAHPSISLLVSCDSLNFPLLWDSKLRDQYNFVFHDTTTFESYAPSEIPSVVDSVNELLNRSGRSVKGKEGVGFVLRSLPENARNLYRILLAELLAVIDNGDGIVADACIDYKVLYQKAVEEFICSSEMGFRQLLKEFLDHEMIVNKRESSGNEILGVPWRREEMEEILEELVS